jgi:hypothetical protein
MNRAEQFIDRVEARGGKLHVEDGRLRCDNPEAIGPYLPELGGCKDAVIQLVRERGTDSASSQGEDAIQELIRKRREAKGRP